MPGDRLALGLRDAATSFLDLGEGAGGQAELPESHPQQQHRIGRTAAHLAAQAHGHTLAPRRLNRHLDQLQHRRVAGVVEPRNVFIAPVHRQRILDQVVRAERKEIDLVQEPVDHHHGRRSLDHHPHGQLPVVGDAVFL